MRHLDQPRAPRVAGECVEEVLQSEAVGVIFKKLEHFSEYNVTVTSHLDHFNQSDTSFQLGRTREYQCQCLGEAILRCISSARSGLQLDRHSGRAPPRHLAAEVLPVSGIRVDTTR